MDFISPMENRISSDLKEAPKYASPMNQNSVGSTAAVNIDSVVATPAISPSGTRRTPPATLPYISSPQRAIPSTTHSGLFSSSLGKVSLGPTSVGTSGIIASSKGMSSGFSITSGSLYNSTINRPFFSGVSKSINSTGIPSTSIPNISKGNATTTSRVSSSGVLIHAPITSSSQFLGTSGGMTTTSSVGGFINSSAPGLTSTNYIPASAAGLTSTNYIPASAAGLTTTNYIPASAAGLTTTNYIPGSTPLGGFTSDEKRITSRQLSGQATTTSRVTGQHQVVSTREYVDESRIEVISERVTEQEVRIPKKIVREEIIEKVIVVPERLVREEVVEEVVKVRQKIIELRKPIIQETIIEVPETEFVEKLVEDVQVVVQEKIKEVPKIEYQERIIEVPKIILQEKVVEVPEYEYIDVPYETIVEVPEIHEQVVLKQIPVPQYVEKPCPEYKDIEVAVDVSRQIPVPVESITTIELKLPKIRPRYRAVSVPLYVPRFVEVAVPLEMMDEQMVANAEHYAQRVSFLASQSAASLCELEKLAGNLRNCDISTFLEAFKTTREMMGFFESAWNSGRLSATGVSNLSSLFSKLTTTTVKSGSSIIGGISTGRTIVGAKSGMTTSGITTSIGTSWGEAGIVGRSSILPSGMTGPIVASLPIGITNVTSAPTVTMKLTEKSTIQNLTSTRSAESLSTKNRNDQLASAELMETQENEKSSKGDKTPSEYEI